MIEVVSGVVIRDGRVLLGQRPASKDFAFAWETIGGKVEGLHESHHDALRREWFEELGVTVGAISEHCMWCGEVPLEGRPSVFLLYYRCDFTGDPVSKEKQGFGWFTEKELRGLDLAPGNKLFLPDLTYALTGHYKVGQ
jgi:8-oxo-dGTP pyrophosphatase MutT (NUDIX family)